jgi:S-adenosylmethionine hydrolase
MIVLFTDFGLQGPYTGQMKAVLHQTAPGIPIIDLFADAPTGNPKASAYLLAAYAQWFAAGTTFLCVVDPGVGGARPPAMLDADGRWYVGPGSGLFELIERRATTACRSRSTGGRRTSPQASIWYENSNGLAEIAVNRGRADRDLGLAIGSPVEIVA